MLPCSNEGCLSLALLSPKRHPFEGTATDPEEKTRIAAALGPTALSLLLDNHGVVCCGSSVPHALRNIWVFTKVSLSVRRGGVKRVVESARRPTQWGIVLVSTLVVVGLKSKLSTTLTQPPCHSVFKACTYQVRALAAAGGDPERLVMPPQEVLDACLERELKQQKDPLGEVEFEAWARGPAI